VVYSSGVLHHAPDPSAAFARIARLARPGGIIVLGVYNAFARIPLRARRLVARLSGYRFIPCDPVLRDRESEPARRKAWVRDQYQQNGVEYVVRTQVQCCARSRRSCSLTPKTTGGLRVGWRNLDGSGPRTRGWPFRYRWSALLDI